MAWGTFPWGAGAWGVTHTPPIITNQSPASGETGVAKDTPILFDAVDLESDIDLETCRAWVRGDLVYDGAGFSAGWGSSFITRITMGYRFNLVPDRSHYHRSDEATIVRAYAEDLTSYSVDESWSFYAVGTGFSTYRYLLGSIRDLDEAGD